MDQIQSLCLVGFRSYLWFFFVLFYDFFSQWFSQSFFVWFASVFHENYSHRCVMGFVDSLERHLCWFGVIGYLFDYDGCVGSFVFFAKSILWAFDCHSQESSVSASKSFGGFVGIVNFWFLGGWGWGIMTVLWCIIMGCLVFVYRFCEYLEPQIVHGFLSRHE